MKSILITGCNRGLGLGIVKHLLNDRNPPKNVIATCRNIEKATELRQLAESNKTLRILTLDVTRIETFDAFSKDVQSIVGDSGLNVLFNNAGYSPKSTRISAVRPEQLLDTFSINTVGPIMLTKALLPTLKQAAAVNESLPLSSAKAAVVNMSSILGSIALNTDGGLYPYRCSKAAINMATKSLSVDLKDQGILVTCIHPGWVQTDMGGSKAPLSVDTSCSGIASLVKSLEEKHHGKFFQYDGQELQW
ncbi:hypothetical protein GWI33_006060 [Rhynchophorus ferrugineus]|uniref:C-factor n=1 Tax=Rhynchophorus ferrugineus TaxID=354439 RepID=A0A834MKB6_RHYFE|nr:hypothetical protein GWI33_006060 [Rhynchophorus ferrugineus]